MCIFCKTNIVENNTENNIIECKNCSSKIEINEKDIYIKKHPNGYKYFLWALFLCLPFWFFVNGFIGFLLKKYFNINVPLFMLWGLFLPGTMSMFFIGIQNIYNFFKNGYMILQWIVTTKDSNKISIIIVLIASATLAIMGFISTYYILYDLIKT
ncbi:MAG: hypothetical protein LBU83_06065 [Bacteroidales bacterium]|jgi:DNA-directed RNA polymerase subunit RPC12/RpoP|nr:hypothetical protein [Bacteroidales bacterium]